MFVARELKDMKDMHHCKLSYRVQSLWLAKTNINLVSVYLDYIVQGKKLIFFVLFLRAWFNIELWSFKYKKYHVDLHNGISYTGKTTSLYWIGAYDDDGYENL